MASPKDATRADLPDLIQGTDHTYTVELFYDGCGEDTPNIAGDELILTVKKERCDDNAAAVIRISQLQPESGDSSEGRGFINMTEVDSSVPLAKYYYTIKWRRSPENGGGIFGILYGRFSIVGVC